MLSLLAICCCLATQTDVAVKPLQGDAVTGKLVQLSEKTVTIQTEGGKQEFEARTLQSIKPVGAAPVEPNPSSTIISVELVDDSLLSSTTFALSGGNCTIQDPFGEEVTAATRLVRSVRFHRQDESVRRQWAAIAAEQRAADVLVVRKVNSAAPGAAEVVLDQLSGIVHDVRESAVTFEFDGERLEVSRAKFEGILFRSPPRTDLPEATCHVRDVAGGLFYVRSIELREGAVALETSAGVKVRRELDQVSEVNYSAANLVYLSDLETEGVEWRPYFQSELTPRSLSKWFEPRATSAILNGESYSKSLALHSRTSITYRLTRDYRQLVAVAGVDERYRHAANLILTIFGDGRPLLTRTIRGADDPFDIVVDMEGVRRLKILVDFGEDRSDAGDLLYLGDARLVK